MKQVIHLKVFDILSGDDIDALIPFPVEWRQLFKPKPLFRGNSREVFFG